MLLWLREILKIYLQYLGAALCAIPAYFVFSVLESVLDSRPAYFLSVSFAVLLAVGVWKFIGWSFRLAPQPTELASNLANRLLVFNQLATDATSSDFHVTFRNAVKEVSVEFERQVASGRVIIHRNDDPTNTEASTTLVHVMSARV